VDDQFGTHTLTGYGAVRMEPPMQRGGPMRRGNFNPATNWKQNATAISVPIYTFTACGIPEMLSPRRQAVACKIL
jgi:hypothetical protein